MMLTLSFIAIIKRGSLIINTVYISSHLKPYKTINLDYRMGYAQKGDNKHLGVEAKTIVSL